MSIMSTFQQASSPGAPRFAGPGAKSEPASPWVEGFHSARRGWSPEGIIGPPARRDRDYARSGLQDLLARPQRIRPAAVVRLVRVVERGKGSRCNGPHQSARRMPAAWRMAIVDKVDPPILSGPQDPSEPQVNLVVQIDYGVCKDICIPAHAELTLDLSGQGDRPACSHGSTECRNARTSPIIQPCRSSAVEPIAATSRPSRSRCGRPRARFPPSSRKARQLVPLHLLRPKDGRFS